jgi:hypothetical protein
MACRRANRQPRPRLALEATANPRVPRSSISLPMAPAVTFSDNYAEHQKNVRVCAASSIAMATRRRLRHLRAAHRAVPGRRLVTVSSRLRSPRFQNRQQHEAMPMALSSMTGFAAAIMSLAPMPGAGKSSRSTQKGLDLRFRLPTGWDALEVPARTRACRKFRRGTVMPISP